MSLMLGIDLGGTNLRAGLVKRDGHVVARASLPLADRTPTAVIRQIVETVRHLQSSSGERAAAIGVGVAGLVEPSSGTVLRSPNLPEWREVPLRDLLAREFNVPLALDNDANAQAVAEARLGAGRGHRHFVLLTLGSGVGGGLILEGKPFHGDRGFAGEVGHIVFDPEGPSCGCGGRGCWELYAASRAFALHASRLSGEEREDLLRAAGVDLADLTPKISARLAEEGNGAALALWEMFGRALGIGIATLVNALDVMTFLIGGGIARSFERFAGAARASALAHTYPCHAEHLLLKPAALGDDAGIIGAALQAFEGCGRSS